MRAIKLMFAISLVLSLATAAAVNAAGLENGVNDSSSAPTEARRVVLVVQNHCAPGADIPIIALTDALSSNLAKQGLQVINPYNAIGKNLNRSAAGEVLPAASAIDVAIGLGADGIVSASVIEFLDSTIGSPVILHQYSIRISLNLADAGTGATICGETIEMKSPKYTNKQVAANRMKYLNDLLYAAAAECASRLVGNPGVRSWQPSPLPPPPPPPPPPVDPELTISDVDNSLRALISEMRTNPMFISNYDAAQKSVDRLPIAVIGGIEDVSEDPDLKARFQNLLNAGAQAVRINLFNSGLFEVKDDDVVVTLAKRIIASGNSPLEDGEIMAALKQHGSPDFFVLGDMRHFVEQGHDIYRMRLALHNLATGKIVWEGIRTIAK